MYLLSLKEGHVARQAQHQHEDAYLLSLKEGHVTRQAQQPHEDVYLLSLKEGHVARKAQQQHEDVYLLSLKEGLINIDAIQSLVVKGILQGQAHIQQPHQRKIQLHASFKCAEQMQV